MFGGSCNGRHWLLHLRQCFFNEIAANANAIAAAIAAAAAYFAAVAIAAIAIANAAAFAAFATFCISNQPLLKREHILLNDDRFHERIYITAGDIHNAKTL